MNEITRRLVRILMLYREQGIINNAYVDKSVDLLRRIDKSNEVIYLRLTGEYKEKSVGFVPGFDLAESEELNFSDITSSIENKIMTIIEGFNCDNITLEIVKDSNVVKSEWQSLFYSA